MSGRRTVMHTIAPGRVQPWYDIQVDRTQPKQKQATETETEAETEAGYAAFVPL